MAEGSWRRVASIGEVVAAVVAQARQLSDGGRQPVAVATGYSDLDEMLGGLRPGSISVVAGTSRASLTSFTVGVLAGTAGRDTVDVCCWSIEMNRHAVGVRFLAAVGRVP